MSSRSQSKEKKSQKKHHHHHHHHKNKSRSKSHENNKRQEIRQKEVKKQRKLKPFEKETWKNDKVDIEKLSDEQFDKEIASQLNKNVKDLKQTEEQLKKLREEDTKQFVPTKKKSPPKFEKLTTADPKMIEVIVNDRLGKNPSDTIGDFKKLIAVQTGTRAEKIKLQKQYCVYRDQITLEDYEIQDGMGMEMYYN